MRVAYLSSVAFLSMVSREAVRVAFIRYGLALSRLFCLRGLVPRG